MSLSILLIWQFIGMFIYFQISNDFIKKEASKILSKESYKEFQTLDISKSDFKKLIWLNKKEFRFRNNIYDVKKINFVKNTVKIKCYLDKKENSLLQSLTSTIEVKSSKSNKNSNQSLLIKILQSPILSHSKPFEIPDFTSSFKTNKSIFSYSKVRFSGFLTTEIKPPINRV